MVGGGGGLHATECASRGTICNHCVHPPGVQASMLTDRPPACSCGAGRMTEPRRQTRDECSRNELRTAGGQPRPWRHRRSPDRADHRRLFCRYGGPPARPRGAGQRAPGPPHHLRPAADRGAPAGECAAGHGAHARRPRGHLVAQQRRMGADAAGYRAGGPGAGQHQSGLPHVRGGIRAQQGGLQAAGDHGALQDQRLPGHAARAGARVAPPAAGPAGLREAAPPEHRSVDR